jgi:glycosyltransferase involved in cell wall biosynthesis
MAKVSIIIPCKNDILLLKTLEDIRAHATGEYEIVVVLDGPVSFSLPAERENLTYIQKPKPEGIREALNEAASRATGQYLLKADAHCMFGENFDEILQKDCQDNWVVIPRRYGMDGHRPDAWERQHDFAADYYYLRCPWTGPFGLYLSTNRWIGRDEERKDIMLDETMGMHGSMWFMATDYYRNILQGLNSSNNASLFGDGEEISLKTWLSGGKVMVNKNTWYAHLQIRQPSKQQREKDYLSEASHRYIAEYWTKNQWEKQTQDFGWLVDRYWPLPTEKKHHYKDRSFWPENWRDYYEEGRL